MSDDTLTLDALVEDVARALRRARLLRAGAGPVWLAFNNEAPAEDVDRAIVRAALAAVAKRMGEPEKLRAGARALAAEAKAMRAASAFVIALPAAFDDCAALLRTLAEAAP